jgi:hypothetical protein
MLRWILSSIIQNTFEKQVGRWQSKNDRLSGYRPSTETPKALLITFRLSVDHDKEDGYRWLELLIYAPSNYVGVLVREHSNVYQLDDVDHYEDDESIVFKKGKGYIESYTDWKCYSYHDSCWRNDGIDRILKEYEERFSGIDFHTATWYTIQTMTPDLIETFAKAIRI